MRQYSLEQLKLIPSKHRPNKLKQVESYLLACQHHFPKWVEVPQSGKTFDSVRIELNEAVRGFLKYEWECALDPTWFKANWSQVTLTHHNGKIYLAPKGSVFDEHFTSIADVSGNDCLVAFDETPSMEVLHALCVLLDKEVLTGHVRLKMSLPDKVHEELVANYSNIEIFTPQNQNYWVIA